MFFPKDQQLFQQSRHNCEHFLGPKFPVTVSSENNEKQHKRTLRWLTLCFACGCQTWKFLTMMHQERISAVNTNNIINAKTLNSQLVTVYNSKCIQYINTTMSQ